MMKTPNDFPPESALAQPPASIPMRAARVDQLIDVHSHFLPPGYVEEAIAAVALAHGVAKRIVFDAVVAGKPR